MATIGPTTRLPNRAGVCTLFVFNRTSSECEYWKNGLKCSGTPPFLPLQFGFVLRIDETSRTPARVGF